jgi:hydrogenase/urease accessory protein HupE
MSIEDEFQRLMRIGSPSAMSEAQKQRFVNAFFWAASFVAIVVTGTFIALAAAKCGAYQPLWHP